MDTRFSMAIQLLVLIAQSPCPMSSAQMAESVGTNPSHVRRILGSLKKAGLVSGQQGTAGFRLLEPPERVSLYRVYCAACAADQYHAFDIHQNSSDECLVGRYIRPVLEGMFAQLARQMEETLSSYSLEDCILALRERVDGGAPEPGCSDCPAGFCGRNS